MIQGHEGPVRDDSRDAYGVRIGGGARRAGNQVFDAGSVEELDVGEGEDLGEEGGGEEGLAGQYQ
jgi:hypothetical protein